MFGLRFIKAAPTTHVIHYRHGRVKRAGAGLSFFYFEPDSSIVLVPLQSVDIPFAFSEITADFQAVTLQGQFSYRIKEPLTLSSLFDFSVDNEGNYRSEDPSALQERLMHTAQVLTRAVCHKMDLGTALGIDDEAIRAIHLQFAEAKQVTALGVEILDFTITSIKPSPEMARALEAQTREELNRRADEAIYQRRNAAVNQERVIKENELETEKAVEEKRRLIREARIDADIALEAKRVQLIDKKVENDRKEADAKAYSITSVIEPLKGADWKILTAALGSGMTPDLMIATAFRELAENAGRIGELNMSPDLLKALLAKKS